ncbi:hypothetical protein [Nitrosomonas communis]|uniref:hypothetical protein n=1 Tax=Nitrosomonas communis TaxID=44574 RepID=UPI003D27CFCD
MSLFKSAGSTLHISAATPGSFNQAGYVALSYTKVGQIESIGDFGNEREINKFIPLDTGIAMKVVGSSDAGAPDIVVALDTDDAGQIMMKAASKSDNAYSFKVTSKQGDIYYFQGYVKKWKVQIGDGNAITKAATAIEIDSQQGGTDVIEVLA